MFNDVVNFWCSNDVRGVDADDEDDNWEVIVE